MAGWVSVEGGPLLVFVSGSAVLGDHRQELVSPFGVVGEGKRIGNRIDNALATVDAVAAVTGGVGSTQDVLALGVELVEGLGAVHEIGERHGELLGGCIADALFEVESAGALLKAGDRELGVEFFGGFGEHGAVGARGRGLANEVDGVGVVLARAVDLQLKVVDVFVVVHDSRPE